jgi:glycosyltransferase involved in cell wall biosynthesis
MRVLFITSVSPYPTTVGGNQRSNLLFRALSDFADVDLVLYTRDGLEDVRPKLKSDFNLVAQIPWKLAGQRFPFAPFYKFHPAAVQKVASTIFPRELDYRPDPAAAERVEKLMDSNDYDIVVGRYLLPTLKSGALGRTPAVLDLDDVDSHIYRSRLELPGLSKMAKLGNYWHYRQIEALLPSRLRLFNRVWITHNETGELDYIDRKVLLPNIPLVPESAKAAAASTPFAGPPVLLFVGSFWHMPNEPAVDYFVEQVWPAVHAACSEAVFRIIGSNMSPEMKARWSAAPGVDAVGFVPDLTAAYAECAFTVVPILSCTGTNIKVLESLAFRRTCVVSRLAHQGFASVLKDSEALLVADDAAAFSAACIRLLRDQAVRARLAARGNELVGQNYSFASFKQTVRSTVESCVNEKPKCAAQSRDNGTRALAGGVGR